MIRYFLNTENIDDFLPHVTQLLKSPTNVIRKKALLVIFDMYEKDKKLSLDIKKIALDALKDSDTSVIFAGVHILKNLVFNNPHNHKDTTKELC